MATLMQWWATIESFVLIAGWSMVLYYQHRLYRLEEQVRRVAEFRELLERVGGER